MARVGFTGASGEVTLAASTAKSILQAKAAANQRCVITKHILMGKQPAGGVDVPCKVRYTQSTSSYGTFSAVTPGKLNPTDPETIQTTIGSNASVEPTAPTDRSMWFEVQPQAGLIDTPTPFQQEVHIPGGYSTQAEFTSPATPVVLAVWYLEE